MTQGEYGSMHHAPAPAPASMNLVKIMCGVGVGLSLLNLVLLCVMVAEVKSLATPERIASVVGDAVSDGSLAEAAGALGTTTLNAMLMGGADTTLAEVLAGTFEADFAAQAPRIGNAAGYVADALSQYEQKSGQDSVLDTSDVSEGLKLVQSVLNRVAEVKPLAGNAPAKGLLSVKAMMEWAADTTEPGQWKDTAGRCAAFASNVKSVTWTGAANGKAWDADREVKDWADTVAEICGAFESTV
eukprot:TRINITY_DN17769_c0_g2_i1.p3 TRINITY_DN17769_c0_g2~~TRINITY_DN17769_c0_g2_i1.p3  ORF type:complete len:243 (+),score=42.38 TRINITY_DN17769_c0_g2_i1:79-807(+)